MSTTIADRPRASDRVLLWIATSVTLVLGAALAPIETASAAAPECAMNATTAPEVLAHITSLIPMRRVGTADEVAELVAWLASDKCSFSTGAVYDISGGRATY
jgi:3-oxoacyl-[acyl-carrier protein] reductase